MRLPLNLMSCSVCMSGTNARPFFELVGQRGSSGLIHPLGGDRSFKPGRVDVFTFPQASHSKQRLG